jgi:hypothetical protein
MGRGAAIGPGFANDLDMTAAQTLIRAITIVATLTAGACGPLCLGPGQTKSTEYQTSESCSGTVEAPASLGLATTPAAACYTGLLPTCVGVDAACVADPSTCPMACLQIEVVHPSSPTTGVAVVVNVNAPFVGERTFDASDPALTIDALSVPFAATPENRGDRLTVTGGTVKLRMVPNEVTATISIDLVTAAGDPIAFKNIQFQASGQSVDYCQND